jgi:hypothetical protein
MKSLSIHEWKSVVKLSAMWCLQAVNDQVFHQDGIDPLTKVLLARDYGFPEGLLHSLNTFIQQGLMKAGDANALGLDYFMKILELQGRIAPAAMPVYCCKCKSRLDSSLDTYFDMGSILRTGLSTSKLPLLFKEEKDRLDDLDADTKSGPEKDSKTAEPVHPGELEKDDTFFHVDVFFLVS